MLSMLSRLFVSALGAAIVVLVMAMPAKQPAEAQQAGLPPGVFILPAFVVPGETFKVDMFVQAQQGGVSTFDIRVGYLESFLDRSATQCDGGPSGSTCTVASTEIRFQRQQGTPLFGEAAIGNMTLQVTPGALNTFGFLRIDVVSMTDGNGQQISPAAIGRVDGIILVDASMFAQYAGGGNYIYPAAVKPGDSFTVKMFGSAPFLPAPDVLTLISSYDIRVSYPPALLSATGCNRMVNTDTLTDASYSCDATTPGEIRFRREPQTPAPPREFNQCFNSIDDDADGAVNDGCAANGSAETGANCSNNADDDADGDVNDGCPAVGPPEVQQCNFDGVDDDGDTFQDDGCLLYGFDTGTMTFQALSEGDGFLAIDIVSMRDLGGNEINRSQLARVDGFISVFAPKTGETEVQVTTSANTSTIEGLGDERNLGFQVGDKILIGNKGASNREERTIVGFGNSFILDSPLAHDHNATETIVKLPGPSPSATATASPGGPTPTPTPVPAGAAATPARTPGTVPSAGGRPGDGTDFTWLALPGAAFGLALAAGSWRAWRRHRSGRRAL